MQEFSITVKKDELLSILETNLQIHIKEYSELMELYKDKAIKETKELLRIAETRDGKPKTSFHLDRPRDNSEDYKTIISMLKMSVNDAITLTQTEYEQYVLDKWSWSNAFAVTKMSYNY